MTSEALIALDNELDYLAEFLGLQALATMAFGKAMRGGGRVRKLLRGIEKKTRTGKKGRVSITFPDPRGVGGGVRRGPKQKTKNIYKPR